VKGSDRTNLGGPRSTFALTQWTQIHAFTGLSPDQQKVVLNELVGRYWKPVYCYLRRKGYGNEQAKDLTQGFFHEIVMGRRLIEQADQGKGRFRTFLLTALDRYVISVHRHERASKRSPGQAMIPLDDEADAIPMPTQDMGPDSAFTYAWALELLQEVLAEVERQCIQDDKEAHWRLFYLHVVEPIMTGRDAPPLEQLCRQVGVATPTQAANMIVTVKRRFREAVKDRVSQYVTSDAEVEQEIRDLMEILSR
jgi:DNA-directed RNA polymerase specialized sigma24 family protein